MGSSARCPPPCPSNLSVHPSALCRGPRPGPSCQARWRRPFSLGPLPGRRCVAGWLAAAGESPPPAALGASVHGARPCGCSGQSGSKKGDGGLERPVPRIHCLSNLPVTPRHPTSASPAITWAAPFDWLSRVPSWASGATLVPETVPAPEGPHPRPPPAWRPGPQCPHSPQTQAPGPGSGFSLGAFPADGHFRPSQTLRIDATLVHTPKCCHPDVAPESRSICRF